MRVYLSLARWWRRGRAWACAEWLSCQRHRGQTARSAPPASTQEASPSPPPWRWISSAPEGEGSSQQEDELELWQQTGAGSGILYSPIEWTRKVLPSTLSLPAASYFSPKRISWVDQRRSLLLSCHVIEDRKKVVASPLYQYSTPTLQEMIAKSGITVVLYSCTTGVRAMVGFFSHQEPKLRLSPRALIAPHLQSFSLSLASANGGVLHCGEPTCSWVLPDLTARH